MSKMSLKLNPLHLALYLDFIIIFKPQLIPNNVWLIFETASLVYISIYLFSKLKINEIVNIALGCLSIIVLLSVINFINGNITGDSLFRGILYYLSLAYIYDIFLLFNKKNKMDQAIRCLCKILVLYCILNLVTIIQLGTVEKYNNIVYFFGNKFRVCYFLIYLLGIIYCISYKKITKNVMAKNVFLFGIIGAMLFAYYIGCSTGAVAIFSILIMTIFQNREHKLISNPKFLITCMIGSGLVVLIAGVILNLNVVQNIIVNILGEDPTLTGRLNIYTLHLFPLLQRSPLIGYGYGNTAMSTASYWYANAQNGLFDFALNNGVIGLAIFLILIYSCLKKSKYSTEKYGLYVILVAMIITAIVEVTFGMFIITVTFLIRWYEPEERSHNQPGWR